MQKRRISQESDERCKESQVESIDMDYTEDISQGVVLEVKGGSWNPWHNKEIESTVELWVYRTYIDYINL
jgi:hypothetical protein